MNAWLICAWCKKKIKPTNTFSGRDSHGICESCNEKVLKELADYSLHKEVKLIEDSV